MESLRLAGPLNCSCHLFFGNAKPLKPFTNLSSSAGLQRPQNNGMTIRTDFKVINTTKVGDEGRGNVIWFFEVFSARGVSPYQ